MLSYHRDLQLEFNLKATRKVQALSRFSQFPSVINYNLMEQVNYLWMVLKEIKKGACFN